jgi:hypothetical protein
MLWQYHGPVRILQDQTSGGDVQNAVLQRRSRATRMEDAWDERQASDVGFQPKEARSRIDERVQVAGARDPGPSQKVANHFCGRGGDGQHSVGSAQLGGIARPVPIEPPNVVPGRLFAAAVMDVTSMEASANNALLALMITFPILEVVRFEIRVSPVQRP